MPNYKPGKGQPLKGLVRFETNLTPELVDQIKAIVQQQGWKQNYTVEQALRAVLGLESDYDLADFEELIRSGKPLE